MLRGALALHTRGLLLGLIACAACPIAAGASAGEPLAASDLERLTRTDRLLIVAPHPDDETLCCAGLIQRALAAGASVAIVWLTSGDAFELDAGWVEHTLRPGPQGLRELGLRRMAEARAAAQRLGVPEQNQIFLGFPDRGLLPLLLDHYYIAYTSPYTRLSAVSYPGTLAPGSSYVGEALVQQLSRVLDQLAPDYVLAPTPLDQHPDHRAAGDLVIRVLGARHQLSRIRYWIVHGGRGWPAPRGLHPAQALLPPRRTQEMGWQSVALDERERGLKREALEAYRTQMFGLERRYLLSFVRRDELFALRALPDELRAPDSELAAPAGEAMPIAPANRSGTARSIPCAAWMRRCREHAAFVVDTKAGRWHAS